MELRRSKNKVEVVKDSQFIYLTIEEVEKILKFCNDNQIFTEEED